jgi:dihydroflavonol-4-reductase
LAAAVEGQLVCENEAEPPKPLSVYVASKREAEVVFREQVARGLDGLIVNPGFMIGPWDWRPSSGRMLITVARSFTPFAPSGGCSVVDVRDVACGILSACFHGRCGENYILAGENVTYFDLWRRMAEISGGRPPWYLIPPRINWLAGKIGDLKTAITGKESIVNSAATQMGALKHWYCSQKAIDQLGYRIGPVDDALADAWDWFRAYGYV